MDTGEDEMNCRKHPDREAIGVCQKYETGFCQECCECLNIDDCCECIDPKVYCKYRTQCMIWEMSRDRRKRKIDKEMRG
jgi:hypothetical protein